MIALVFQQYYPNYIMITIESLISLFLLFFIVRVANNSVLKEERISQHRKNLSINISILIALGIILAIRYLFAFLGFFNSIIVLFNNQYLFFAVFSSLFYLIFWRFIKRFESKRDSDDYNNQNIKFLKRAVLIIGVSWVNALIFLSIDLLGIPLGDFLPTDVLNPSYDVFLLGFEWAFFIVVINISFTIIINTLFPLERRLPKEILYNTMLFGGIISFGIWANQLVVVELYLSRLFNIHLYEQDIRILALTVSIVYIISFFISLKWIFIPKTSKLSLQKVNRMIQKDDDEKTSLTSTKKENVILDVQNLTTYFYTEEGIVRAIENVSFKIYQGEILGLVGETGCGKTVTALSILNLIQTPGKLVNGNVIFDNINLTTKSEREILPYRGDEITMIFQDPLNSLNPVFKVGDQISEVFLLHKEKELLIESSKSQNKSIFSIARQWTGDLLKDLNIPAPEAIYERYPHELSGGMRQRIQIAMALACSPKLLIADEPTTALDVTIQNQILKLMKDLKKKYNTSILFITHDLGVISRMCDRVAVMYSGYIVEYGSKRTLFSNPYHPYTKKLIQSVPVVGKKKELLEIIPGMVPNLIYPPSGCRFHPRCDFCFEACNSVTPELLEVEPNYFVSCHLYNPIYHKEVLLK